MLKKLFTIKMIFLLMVAGALNTFANDTLLEKTFSSLGYRVTGKIAAAAADWELRDFKMQSKKFFSLKSKKKVPGEKNLYYRFTVKVEEFANEADAQKRLEHIQATPPGPDSKMIGPEHDLREGFRRGKTVYVVSTNVYTFVADKSLSRFRENLDQKIPKVKCPDPKTKCQ